MKLLLTCIALLFILGCENNGDSDLLSSNPGNKNYVMHVDRYAVNFNIQFPSDEINESDYAGVIGEKIYEIYFHNNLQSVEIEFGDQIILGEIAKNEKYRREYYLSDGLFAGGRFIVWQIDKQLHAEFTVYGSGVPIISSERGVLKPIE